MVTGLGCLFRYSGLPKAMVDRRPVATIMTPSRISQATAFADLPTLVFPLLRQLGPSLTCNPVLVVKVNRLAKAFLEQVRTCACPMIKSAI